MRDNRYAQKRKHKQKLQEHYATLYAYPYRSVNKLRDYLILEAEADKDTYWRRKHPPRNHGWEYWRIYYVTGRRKIAKKYTNKAIRQKYRMTLHTEDLEDIQAMKGSDYEKEFDYAWTIW